MLHYRGNFNSGGSFHGGFRGYLTFSLISEPWLCFDGQGSFFIKIRHDDPAFMHILTYYHYLKTYKFGNLTDRIKPVFQLIEFISDKQL